MSYSNDNAILRLIYFVVSAIAEYSSFLVGDASTFYEMNAAGNSGTAGDGLFFSNGYDDADHDARDHNCAVTYQGAWWHNRCHEGMLTGVYSDVESVEHGQGITWKGFGERRASRRTAIMSLQ